MPFIKSDFSIHSKISYNGLHPGQSFLPRGEIINKISNAVRENTFITIASPAAAGKTSILCLIP
jgi:ABC-type cobalamin/Fe3+-siderophores transport system ATPase subunit